MRAGSEITRNDDIVGVSLNSQIIYTATTTGIHYLSAQAYSTNTGTYRLSASNSNIPDDYAGSTATSGTLAVGGSVTGNIELAADEDWFAHLPHIRARNISSTLRAAQPGQGTLSDTYLRLLDSTGGQITFNDDFGTLNSQITYTATTSGIHYLSS